MTESQEEIEFNRFYSKTARYYKESEEMSDLRKENTNSDETTQTFLEVKHYHDVLDSAGIPYPIPIEKCIQMLKVVSCIQNEIKEIEDDRKTN